MIIILCGSLCLLCVPIAIGTLCNKNKRTVTELHRGITELHRDKHYIKFFLLEYNFKNYFINITGYVSLLTITCAGKDYIILNPIDG